MVVVVVVMMAIMKALMNMIIMIINSLLRAFPDSHTRFSLLYHGGVLQSTPLPALASQHTIC
jgi:hypothetical protein